MGRKRIYTNDAARQAARRARLGIEPRAPKEGAAPRKKHDPARQHAARIKKWQERPILGIDGEGRDTQDGDHILTLLAMGDGKSCQSIENQNGLSSAQCLAFLFDARAQYRASYGKDPLCVIFAGSYDFTMMIKSLNKNDIQDLYQNPKGTVVYLNGQRYWIRIVQRKMMRIARWKDGKKESFTIYDVFGFFQAPFVKTLIDWNIERAENLSEMQAMKDNRASFAADDSNAIRTYNETEIRYLVLLVSKLREALDDCGFYITSWHGAGAIAGYIMQQHDVKEHIVKSFGDEGLDEAIQCAYFGGRVQLLQAGLFDHVTAHDVVSAYPSAHVNLPSLKNWRVSHIGALVHYERMNEYPYALWRVSWRLPDKTPIQPFPIRESSNIYYEQAGEGWYWYPEVAAAIKHFGKYITLHEGYIFHPESECRPFGYIKDLFELRKVYKREGNAAEKPLKLGYNSHYGKHAQHREKNDTRPPTYQCYWYAGYITSVCRAKVLDLCMRKPEAIIAIATDGVFATERLTRDEEESNELGGWERNEHTSFFIVQPGIYTYIDAKYNRKYKTRGLRPSEVDWAELERYFTQRDRIELGEEITVKTSRFIGLKTACARNRIETIGRWDRGERHISLLLHPTRATTPGILYDNKLQYYGRLDDGNWRKRIARHSEPFIGRYDDNNTTDYVLELSEIDDNPEIWGE